MKACEPEEGGEGDGDLGLVVEVAARQAFCISTCGQMTRRKNSLRKLLGVLLV